MKLIVSEAQSGSRLDLLVASMEGVQSRRKARSHVETGKVDVDGVTVGPHDASRTLAAGAEITLHMSRPGTHHNRARAGNGLDELGLPVLFADAHLIAIDKPAGLLTDTATHAQEAERDSLKKRLEQWLRGRTEYPVIVHRIDRDTTGAVVVARSEAAGEHLREQFRNRQPERVYRAILQGAPAHEAGTWKHWMRWDSERLLQRPCRKGDEGAVLASADYRILRGRHGLCLVEVRLHTGRRNQIRLHAQLEGCPLLGERQYLPKGWKAQGPRMDRQALHAFRLVVKHPVTGQPVAVEAPLPADMGAVVHRL